MKSRWHLLLFAGGLTAAACAAPTEGEDQASNEMGENASSESAMAGPIKMAMTWTLLSSVQPDSSRAFVLVGSDNQTNPYSGDTSTHNYLPVLCVNKPAADHPGSVIGAPSQTPGGAWRRTWSSGVLALTVPVQGASLTSRARADSLCASEFGAGFRMAEFHDGDGNLWSGWDFWGTALDGNLCSFQGTRFWVAIHDQNSNPW